MTTTITTNVFHSCVTFLGIISRGRYPSVSNISGHRWPWDYTEITTYTHWNDKILIQPSMTSTVVLFTGSVPIIWYIVPTCMSRCELWIISSLYQRGHFELTCCFLRICYILQTAFKMIKLRRQNFAVVWIRWRL